VNIKLAWYHIYCNIHSETDCPVPHLTYGDSVLNASTRG